MSDRHLRYIVYAPSYDENSGGNIFLHQLVSILRSLGEEAVFWPMGESNHTDVRRLFRRKRSFRTLPHIQDAQAKPWHLKEKRSVVVYPEVTFGNPLGVENVIRWFLYQPGKLHPFEFGPNDMFFRVDEMSDILEITGGAPDLFVWKANPVYQNQNRPDRKGLCFIVRKHGDKPRIPETQTQSAVQIDGMDHAEINEVFNRCQTFVSYDDATMYSQYAAICGCDSVVVPDAYPSRAAWTASHAVARYGIAYGFADLDHARATRHKTKELLLELERKGIESVKSFITLTRARFK
ncbi:hypothetical protein [Yoonia sp. SDW83-1]|uniref:hypothetical protein n=1 Tax=Yoonia sp. SDW83-1 TaxID=3366945 RepID=UPI00398C2708